jgi:putative salt-induced outer membrane protein YdiY
MLSTSGTRIPFLRLATCTALVVCLAASGMAQDKDWEVSVAAGGSLTDGNSETRAANAGIVGERTMDKKEMRVGAEGNFGEQKTAGQTVTTVQNAKAFAKCKRLFEGYYAYVDGNVLHDDIADLDYRVTLGPGLGKYLVKDEKNELSVEGGGAWVREEFGSGIEDDYAAVRLAQRLDHKMSDTAKVWESVEFLPRADDWGDYLLHAELGAEAAMNASLSLRVVVQDRYDSEPPPSVADENDLAVIGSLVYTLR